MARPPNKGNLSAQEIASTLVRYFSTRGVVVSSVRDLKEVVDSEGQGNATVSTVHEALQELAASGVLTKDGDKMYAKLQQQDIQTVARFGVGCNRVLDHARESKLSKYSLSMRETWLPAQNLHRTADIKGPGPQFEGDTEHGSDGFFQRLYETLTERAYSGRETEFKIAIQAPSEMIGLMKRLAQVENMSLEWPLMEKEDFKTALGKTPGPSWLLVRALASATMVTHMSQCFRNFASMRDAIKADERVASKVSLSLSFYTGWNSFPLLLGEGIACKGDYSTYASCWAIPALLIQRSSALFAVCERDVNTTLDSALPSTICHGPGLSCHDMSEWGEDGLTVQSFCERLLNDEGSWLLYPYEHSIEMQKTVAPGTAKATVAMIKRAQDAFEAWEAANPAS